MNASLPRFHLYHRIADKECAEARSLLLKSPWGEKNEIRFRNIDTGPEALADLKTLSSTDKVPFLHDTLKDQKYVGLTQISEFLRSL